MTNDDLISRAYVLAEYDRQHKGPPGGARKIMEEAPAVDAAPVVHGRWVEVEDCVWKCSVCGEEDCYAYTWGEVKRQDDLFCPHCGAKMDGGEKDGEQ